MTSSQPRFRLVHCVGDHGAFWKVWMRSLECQVQSKAADVYFRDVKIRPIKEFPRLPQGSRHEAQTVAAAARDSPCMLRPAAIRVARL